MSLPYRKRWYLRHPDKFYLHAIKQPIRRYWQRARRGWCVDDAWDLHSYLDRLIPAMLDHMRHNSCSWPGEPMTPEEWSGDGGILDRIAQGFRAHLSILDYDWETDAEMKELEKRHKDGMKLFVKWYGHLWD